MYRFHLDHLIAHYKRYHFVRNHRRHRLHQDLVNQDVLDFLVVEKLMVYYLNHLIVRVVNRLRLNHHLFVDLLGYKNLSRHLQLM